MPSGRKLTITIAKEGDPVQERSIEIPDPLWERAGDLFSDLNRLLQRIELLVGAGPRNRPYPAERSAPADPDPRTLSEITIVPSDDVEIDICGQSTGAVAESKPPARPADAPTPSLEDAIILSDDLPGAPASTDASAGRTAAKSDRPATRAPRPAVRLIVRHSALKAAWEHARSDLKREVGGVMLGRFIVDRNERIHVLMAGIVRADLAVSHSAHLDFTPEAWAEIWRHIDADPDYGDDQKWRIVGWYHTHPRYGIFLSAMDLPIHECFFRLPGHIALVIDPVQGLDGFFCWDEDQVQVGRCDQQVTKAEDSQLTEWYRRTFHEPDAVLPPPLIPRPGSARGARAAAAERAAAHPAPTPPVTAPDEQPAGGHSGPGDDRVPSEHGRAADSHPAPAATEPASPAAD